MSNKRRKIALKRITAGYEADPPRCGNCVSYQAHKFGTPRPGNVAKPYTPPRCEKLTIAVKKHAICDLWQGKSGEVLE